MAECDHVALVCDLKSNDSSEEPSSQSSGCTAEFSPTSERSSSESSHDLTLEIEDIFLETCNNITQKMLYSPIRTSSCPEKRSNAVLFPFSPSKSVILLSLRKQLLHEINQSDWRLSVINAPRCRSSLAEDSATFKAQRENRINSVFESSLLHYAPTNKQDEAKIIEMEREALEHRLMLVLITFLVVKQFRKNESHTVLDLVECYYNCFRILIKENAKIKSHVKELARVPNLGRNLNRIERLIRLIENNRTYISHVWYGFFLARLQAGILEGIVENVESNIDDINRAIESMKHSSS